MRVMGGRGITALTVVGALASAAGLVAAGAYFAERYRWCCLHDWALVHGMIFVLFPLYAVLSYVCLLPLTRQLLAPNHPHRIPGRSRMSWLAVWSLVLSGAGFLVPILGSVPALACGHAARRFCRTDPGLRGSGIALTGLVIGYCALGYSIYLVAMVAWVAFHAR
jgi:uncharacterized protein DUF4190